MAYASWLTPSKTSGSGNDTVNVSAASSNTGRNQRTTTVTFKAANCSDVARTVNQAGKAEFVTFDNATASVAKTGGTLTVTGKSNSSKLTFSLGTSGNLSITLPSSYTANSASTNNGASISGDPGATSQYAFSITFSNIAANTTISSKTKQLIVTPNGGASLAATCTISQAAGDPTLSVSPEAITIPWDASESKTFTVTSNTSWTVE